MKVEVTVLGSPSLISLIVSADVKAALNLNNLKRAWEGPRNQSFSLHSGVNGDCVSRALRILLVHVPALPDGREVESFFGDTLTNQPP